MGGGVAYGVFVARPISSVHIDIADFLLEVTEIDFLDRAEWVTRLAKCLAKRDPSMHDYGKRLLEEVEEFRRNDKERKLSKDSKESNGFQGNPAQSRQSRAEQTDRALSLTAISRADKCLSLYPKQREHEGKGESVHISKQDKERLISLIESDPRYPFEFAIQSIKTKRPKNLKGFLDELPAIESLLPALKKELITRCQRIDREHPEVNRDVSLCEPFMDDDTRIIYNASREY